MLIDDGLMRDGVFFFLVDIDALDDPRVRLMNDQATIGDMHFFTDLGNPAQFMLHKTADRHGIDAVYRSIGDLALQQRYFGGILRSLHRYASDGFMLVMLLHLLREWCYGRYFGFRLYSWVTGVPLLWLAYIAGIGGYWIVWDQLAQLSAIATTELLWVCCNYRSRSSIECR